MKKRHHRVYVLTVLLLFLTFTIGYAKGTSELYEGAYKNSLSNGMTYYLHKNNSEEIITIALIVHVGSVLENKKQRGLAHFVEHVAFNGTEKYPFNALVTMLEEKGLFAGRDFNVNINYDYTVFRLTVPSKAKEYLDIALDVINEWAFHLTYDEKSIEKGKESLAEEIKLYQQSLPTVYEKLRAFFLEGSEYAKRSPSGTLEVINNAKRDDIKSFYDIWYKPNLMAIAVLGDINVQKVKKKIETIFTNEADVIKRPEYAIPLGVKNDVKVQYFMMDNKEQAPMGIMVYGEKYASTEMSKEAAINRLVYPVALRVIDRRFSDVAQQSDNLNGVRTSIAVHGRTYIQTFIEFFSYKNKGLKGYKEFLLELERLRRYGISLEQLDEALASQIAFSEAVSKNNLSFLDEIISDFINGIDIINYKTIATIIQKGSKKKREDFLAKVNAYLANVGNTSTVHFGFIFGKDETLPEKKTITSLYHNVSSLSIKESLRATKLEPLTALINKQDDKIIKNGKIVSKKYNTKQKKGIFTLSNGITVIFQRTNGQANDIAIHATAQNANITKYVKTEADVVTSYFVSSTLQYVDFGVLSSNSVYEYLMQKSIYVNFSYGGMRTITINSPAQNSRDVFQMLHVLFSGLRYNEAQLRTFKQNVKDSIVATISDLPLNKYYWELAFPNNPFTFDFTEKKADIFNPVRAVAITDEALSNPSEYTFVISGNITFRKVQELAKKYLGSLKTKKADIQVASFDIGITKKPENTITYTRKGKQSLVLYGWIKDQKGEKYSLQESSIARVVASALNIALTNVVKEQKSLVSAIVPSIDFGIDINKYTNITVSFESRPDQVKEAIKESKNIIIGFVEQKLDEQIITYAKNTVISQIQDELTHSSSFFSYNLQQAYQDKKDIFSFIDDLSSLYDTISYDDVSEYLKQFLQNARYVEVIQNPKK